MIQAHNSNKPHLRRQYQRPVFAEENYPLSYGNSAYLSHAAPYDSRSGVFKVAGYEQTFSPQYQTFSQQGQHDGYMQPIFPIGVSVNSGGHLLGKSLSVSN